MQIGGEQLGSAGRAVLQQQLHGQSATASTRRFIPRFPARAGHARGAGVGRGQAQAIHVLARQPIDMSNPHPFTEAGNSEFNAFLWMPPRGKRAGDILLAGSTIFSTLFGGDESLQRFWRNLAQA
jgi:hypothetical protein